MDNIIKSYIKTSPFPYIDARGNIYSVDRDLIPVQCHTCTKPCRKYFDKDPNEKIKNCPLGYNVFNAKFKKHNLVFVGLLIKGFHEKIPRKDKKKTSNKIISLESLLRWENETSTFLKSIEDYKDSCVKDSLAVYHDITPTISLIFRTLEALISDVPGATFDEKVDNSDIKHRTLYHAINLLDNRLKMMPLISNPDAAKFGQVSKCSPFKLFDKLRRLFQDTANKKGVILDLQSSSYITLEPLVYDSFITIPFVLVENAIKYSVNNGTVHIHLKQKGNTVIITVTSFGPIVTAEDADIIFEKGYKDPNAKKFASQGSGIGLYLATIVAKAHNLEISYKKGNTKIEKGIEMGSNTFSFQLAV
jgi:hypothetical protein